MNEKDLYNYSKGLRLLEQTLKKLQSSHVYRYSRLVDTSSKGLECSYAKMIVKMLPEEHEEFLAALTETEKLSALFKDKYIEEYINDKEKTNN